MLNKRQTGFTLVEIAIVLVIVGLLIGGVLKGQEMITNAKLKRVESDNAGLLAGMYSYQDRYLQLPGDDNGAEGRFTDYVPADNANGNGDGAIDGVFSVTSPASPPWATDGTQESIKFFGHLRAAGLIAGGSKELGRLTNSFGGQIGVQNGSLAIPTLVAVFTNIGGSLGVIIDNRVDDGIPNSGRVMAQDEAATTPDMSTSGTADSTYDDAKSYNRIFRL